MERTKLLRLRIYLKFLHCPSPFNPLYFQSNFKPRLNVRISEQTRSQNFAMGGAVLSNCTGRGLWRSASEVPSHRRMRVWGQSLQPPEARGMGGSPQRSKFLHFFCKNNNFRTILIKSNAFKTCTEIGSASMIKLVA